MSAERLREAAALMRSRAEAATSGAQWTGSHYWIEDYDPSDPSGQTSMQRLIGGMDAPDSDHYSSWHPAVALAVADWLDRTADILDRTCDCNWPNEPFAVANAYLGATS